jgi:hypothetical protein
MVRRPETFQKSSQELLVGDYLQVAHERFTGERRGLDEGFHRVERIEYLDEAAVGELFRGSMLWNSGAVVVFCHGIPGAVVLPIGDVTVLADVNPERRANDERGQWHLPADEALFRAGRLPSDDETWWAQTQDNKLRPAPAPDAEGLYPAIFDDPFMRKLWVEGVRDLRLVPLSELPWPHGIDCRHRRRFLEILDSYPKKESAPTDRPWPSQAAAAQLFLELTEEEGFATCSYHQAGWVEIGEIAHRLVAAGDWRQAWTDLDVDGSLEREDRHWLYSLFRDPIRWDEGGSNLINGQHRLCALRAAGVSACPVDGLHFPTAALARDPSEPPTDHARRIVGTYRRQLGASFWRRVVGLLWRRIAGRTEPGRSASA